MLHIDLYSDSNLEGAAEQILADTGLSNVSLSPNAAYDSTMNQNINREVLPMAICMVLVFASGYLIIYNIFQISVASDIRFYGRLKTLGTTKRQLKKMIYGQANRLSLIGIPCPDCESQGNTLCTWAQYHKEYFSGVNSDERKFDYRLHRKSELRKDNTFQCLHRCKSESGKLARCNR